MIKNYKKPEILAPCGSYDIMIAAINAGADACYFGGFKFGARAYATNFDIETSIKAIDYAHIHGTSLYLTVNTLFKDYEIKDLYDYILPYYKSGLDAVIVQDFGVFNFIKDKFPDINIHCSTQMNINSMHAAIGMKKLGASRIVTAREMTLDEIAQIKENVDIEIESFVHGAMCYSYSGRCLMSSLAGGRSGNRGRCAQPCRKCYDGEYILSMKDMCTLTDVPQLIEAGIDSLKIEGRMKNEYYVASAVDAYNQIATDYIEGCYSEKKAEALKFKLANIYNRGGFCDGYYFIQGGPDMISKKRPNNQGVTIGKVIYAKNGEIGLSLYEDLFKQDVIELKLKTSDGVSSNSLYDNIIEITSGIDGKKGSQVSLKCPKTKFINVGEVALRTRCNYIINDVKTNIIDRLKVIDINGEFCAHIGYPISFKVSRYINGQCISFTAYKDEVSLAREKATDMEDIRHKLNQLGNTCYQFNKLSLDVDSEAFVPAGLVKKLRREAIDGLEKAVCDHYRRISRINSFEDKAVKLSSNNIKNKANNSYKLNISVSNYEQLELVMDFPYIDGIILDLNLYECALKNNIIDKLLETGIKLYIDTPYVTHNNFDISTYLQYKSISGIYIRNVDTMFAYINYKNAYIDSVQSNVVNINDFKVICTDGVYAYNNMAREFIMTLIPEVIFELPKELNKSELNKTEFDKNFNNQLVIYEYQQVMVSNQCVIKNKYSCNRLNQCIKLKDDKNNIFFAKAVCEECINIIYNGIPYNILGQLDKKLLDDLGTSVLKVSFTIEDNDMIINILQLVKAFIESNYNGKEINYSNNIYTAGHFNRGVE